MKENIQKAYPYVMSIFISVVDFWSIAHFINGVICVLLFGIIFSKSSSKNLLYLSLAIAFAWEGAELAMELGYLGAETSAGSEA